MFRTKTIHADAQFPGHNVQYAGNAMPSRPAKQTVRNLTGLYLGTDDNKEVVKKGEHLITSLGKGRGMPSQKIRTPTEERRYKKVELLRIKEEKRGFTGNMLKRRQMIVEPDSNETYHRHAFYESQDPITFWDITRQTPRKFTAANNSGVTHLEYLGSDHSSLVSCKEANVHVVKTVAREIQEAALDQRDIGGVIECYNRICRGNVEALFSLLPPKHLMTQKSQGDFKRTGFSVKSYRNPNKAEIMASFPDGDDRPKTVLGTSTWPQIPSPYFYKNYDQPKTSMDRYRDINYTPYSDAQLLRTSPTFKNKEARVPGVPGTGQLSRSVSRGRQNTSPKASTPLDTDILNIVLKEPVTEESELPAPTTTPRQGSIEEATDTELQAQGTTGAILVPGVGEDLKSVDGFEFSADHNSNNNTAIKQEDTEISLQHGTHVSRDREGSESSTLGSSVNTPKGDNHKSEPTLHAGDMTQSAAGNRLEKMPSGTDIIIGVEDEKGELKPVEIDETDDQLDDEVSSNGSVRRKVSITERILKSKNSEEQVAHFQKCLFYVLNLPLGQILVFQHVWIIEVLVYFLYMYTKHFMKKTNKNKTLRLKLEASNRKKQLEELLDEHAQLVHEVDSMTDSPELVQQENKENQR